MVRVIVLHTATHYPPPPITHHPLQSFHCYSDSNSTIAIAIVIVIAIAIAIALT